MWRPTEINPSADRAVYRQIADDIRSAAASGQLLPGEALPGERRLAAAYRVGVDAVRDAMALLRAEGLILTERGKPSRIRHRREPAVVEIPPGKRIAARPATEEERREHSLPEGSWVLVVKDRDGGFTIYRADENEFETTSE